MKVAVFGQFENTFPEEHVNIVLDTLQKHHVNTIIEGNCLSKIQNINDYASFNTCKDLDESFDFLISIGGDGTILRAISLIRNLNIPIIGVNTGRLGFLSTIQKEEIETSITKIIEGKYIICSIIIRSKNIRRCKS